jgi:prophage DNA circulation protein
MAAAAEVAGAGTLVHPSIGTITASLMAFSAGENADRGRVVELTFEFIENPGRPIFPTNAVSTQQATGKAADNAASAVGNDFTGQVSDIANA